MAPFNHDALEALIAAANEYAAATAACDAAALEAAKKTSLAAHKAAMIALEAAIVHVKATASYVLLVSSMYEANREDECNGQQ